MKQQLKLLRTEKEIDQWKRIKILEANKSSYKHLALKNEAFQINIRKDMIHGQINLADKKEGQNLSKQKTGQGV